MTLIQTLDGTVYNLEDYGIKTVNVIISSPNYVNDFVSIEGGNGVLDNGTSIGPRDILVQYQARSKDIPGFSLLRDEIFNLFRSDRAFYLIEKRTRGKRWLVKIADKFQIPQRNIIGNFDINFIGIKGYAESAGTSMDIVRDGINSNSDLWGFGMGLIADDDTFMYKQTIEMPNISGVIRIYNAGNIPIHHPFEQELKITITNVKNANNFAMMNVSAITALELDMADVSTLPAFGYTESLTQSQTLILDNAEVKLNGLNVMRRTYRTFMFLIPGWNEIFLTGATEVTLEFDFPFYYL